MAGQGRHQEMRVASLVSFSVIGGAIIGLSPRYSALNVIEYSTNQNWLWGTHLRQPHAPHAEAPILERGSNNEESILLS